MTRLEILPFCDDHLDEAAVLLAARHRRHRAAEPLLPGRFEDPAAARDEIEQAWRAEHASGTAAFRGGQMIGYLVGAPRANPLWGDNIWVEAPGHAVEEAETIRDLYAVAAARWVEEGRPRHSVLAPAFDGEILDAWWRLSFGSQHAYGVASVPPGTFAVPGDIEIRGPRAEELEQLVDIHLALPEHQRESPVFGGIIPPTRQESRDEWLETMVDDDEKILIGAINGRALACWSVVPAERSSEHRGLLRPDHCCFLGFAATLPEARGRGIGVALTEAAFSWAAAQGYPVMITDWRVTNLLSSKFWPKRGFRTSFLRLYRSIP